MTLVDSHCHLDDSQFDPDRDAAIQRALDAGVTRMLAIGTGEGPPDLEAALRLADRYENIAATAGIHPQYAPNAGAADFERLTQLLRHRKCVAVGEIGLDYYWKPFDKELQAAVFVQQMRIAAASQKPIIIHTRDAWQDTMNLLKQHWAPTGLPCVLHCFTGGPDEAREALDLRWTLSFAGVVTYPKAVNVQEAARMAPLDQMLVETDSPYLPPVPYRGKRNEPAYVAHTAAFISKLRGIAVEEVARATSANFDRIFGPVGYTEGFK
ncbi:MAG TPA: TatD family hydrolase [Bryobacteraceae bacterium]|nr:TatD family hydrolase [Bryobacteraceae bacterium]